MINKSIQDAVMGYTAKKNEQNTLNEGTHRVKLVDWKPTHSRVEWNGETKTDLPDFDDPTPQLGVMFRNENGVTWHRFNMSGYKRWNQLTDEEAQSDKFEKVIFGETAYACVEKSGKTVRIKDKARTEDAHSIVDQFMTSVGMVGKSVGELGAVVSAETELQIKIISKEYKGEPQLRITNFAKVGELVESDDLAE